MRTIWLLGALQLALVTSMPAQQPLGFIPPGTATPSMSPSMSPSEPPSDTARAVPHKTFFTRRDLALVAGGLAASAAISAFDVRISHFVLQPTQQSSGFHSVVRPFNNVSETTVSWATAAGYIVGRLSHWELITDVSVHMGEAEIISTIFGQTIRGILGRARPSASPDDQYSFHYGQGFTHFPYRAFPSLHSAAGFILASTVTEEVHLRAPAATWYVGPVLYLAAAGPGLARMYLGQHWASDVFAGAVLGTFLGYRVASYAHSHRRSKLDRFLIGAVPDGHGGVAVAVTIVK